MQSLRVHDIGDLRLHDELKPESQAGKVFATDKLPVCCYEIWQMNAQSS